MSSSPDALETSYAFCRRLSRRAGSSFHAGFLLLPREQRRAMEALYAFMRCTDDLADEGTGGGGRGTGEVVLPNQVPGRRESLAAWRAALQQALAANPPSTFPLPPSALFPALADVVHRFRIPHEHLLAVIDGVEMDLAPRRFETFDELEPYCERVASAVGLACIYIWGFRGPEAFEPARQAGVALQLTNILRDVKEDAAAGRVYLPLADLRCCGYSEEELAAGTANGAFLDLMRLEIERTKQFYRAAGGLRDWLEPDGRLIFGLMTATYRKLLEQIERCPADVLRRRIRVGSLTKLRLFARWMVSSRASSSAE